LQWHVAAFVLDYRGGTAPGFHGIPNYAVLSAPDCFIFRKKDTVVKIIIHLFFQAQILKQIKKVVIVKIVVLNAVMPHFHGK
jgi:hypothetical protein